MSEQGAEIHRNYLHRKLQLAAAVENYFRTLIADDSVRLRGVDRCLDRFNATVRRLDSDQTGASLSAVDEAHNELCVVDELLHFSDPPFSLVEYEPRLPAGERRIDFCARHERASWFVEVKPSSRS
jgi:hypothetical protein